MSKHHEEPIDCRALTREHPIPDGDVRLLGAWETVTGATTQVSYAAGSLLVDCGIAQGRDRDSFTMPDEAADADAVVLTHGHYDHIGSLPALFEAGYAGPIYATGATLAVAEVVLRDSIRLSGGSDRDVARVTLRMHAQRRRLPYDQPLQLLGATVTLHEAGHILGSASVELTTDESRVIVSGDLGRPGSPILRDPNRTWSSAQPVSLVVMESTYGAREHACGHDRARADLGRIVRRALSDGGHILVPAFAIGRTQLLLHYLDELMQAGIIPPIPVALDTPMGLRVTELYDDWRRLFDRDALDRIAHGDDPLDFGSLYAVRRGRDSVRLRDVSEPMLIIAGSGMCTGGRIIGHLKDLLPRDETCVVFVGYQAPGTPGHDIQRAARGATIHLDGEPIAIRATTETLSGLSAHADRAELRDWLSHIPAVQRVALHHGEPDAQRALAQYLRGAS